MGTIYRNSHQYVGQNTDSASLIHLQDGRTVQEGVDDLEEDVEQNATDIETLNSNLNQKLDGFFGFERFSIDITSHQFVDGVNTISFNFDHQLSKSPSFLLVAMPQTSIMYITSYGLSKTGGTIRLYYSGSTFTGSMTIVGLAVYNS